MKKKSKTKRLPAYKANEDMIRSLYAEGLSDNKIRERLRIPTSRVYGWRKQNGLPPNGTVPLTIDMVDELNARCSRCLAVKNIKEFAVVHLGHKYQSRYSYCRSCSNESNKVTVNKSIETYLRRHHSATMARALRSGVVYDLPPGELYRLYTQQRGLCFYTGVEMEWKVGRGRRPNGLSVDRIDPNGGYVIGNIALCTARANTIKNNMTPDEFKSWMPSWYEKTLKIPVSDLEADQA